MEEIAAAGLPEAVLADHQVQRLAGGAQREAISPTTLPAEALRVEAALAADDGVGPAQARVEPDRVEDEGGAGPQPAPKAQRPPRARRRSRSSARRAGRAGSSAASAPAAPLSRSTAAGSAPFCGAEDARRVLLGAVASQRTSISAPPSRPRRRSASIAPAPPSVVALPPTATSTVRAPAAPAAAISSPVPKVSARSGSRSVRRHQGQPGGLRRLDDRRLAVVEQAEARLDRPPQRVVDRGLRALAAECARAARPSSPRRRRRRGSGRRRGAALARARPRSPRPRRRRRRSP